MAYSPAPLALGRSKPSPWNVEQAFVSPAYQELWRGLRVAVAWPDSQGRAINLVTRELGTIEGTDLRREIRPLGSVWRRTTVNTGHHLDLPFQIDPSTTPFTAVAFLHVDAAPGDEITLHQHDGTGTGRNWIQHSTSPDVWGSFLGGSEFDTSIAAVVGEMNMVAVRFDGSSTMVVGANGDWSNNTELRTPESATGDHIWMDHKSVDQAPDDTPGYGFYIWDRYLSDAELDPLYIDPFALVRPNWDYVTAAFDPANLQASVVDDDVTLTHDASF